MRDRLGGLQAKRRHDVVKRSTQCCACACSSLDLGLDQFGEGVRGAPGYSFSLWVSFAGRALCLMQGANRLPRCFGLMWGLMDWSAGRGTAE